MHQAVYLLRRNRHRQRSHHKLLRSKLVVTPLEYEDRLRDTWTLRIKRKRSVVTGSIYVIMRDCARDLVIYID